jgi:hypothetical protein
MQGLFNGLRNGNQGMFDDIPEFDDAGGIQHMTRFKEEEERIDLLKDIRGAQ